MEVVVKIEEKIVETIDLDDLVEHPDLYGFMEEVGRLDELEIDEEENGEPSVQMFVVINETMLNQSQVFDLVDRIYGEAIETEELEKMMTQEGFNLLAFISGK